MRSYTRPELRIEAFDVDDVITASGLLSPGGIAQDPVDSGAAAPAFDQKADAAEQTTLFPQSTVADPSGAFQQQVTGGNIIQEGLNNLYENFLGRF